MANSILGKVVDFEKVLENRKRFLSTLDISIDNCLCMWVLGSDGVLEADKSKVGISMKDYKKAVKVDALITNQKELYLFLLTADCAPVIIFDPVKKVLGLVHVGWKGADLEIVRKVIKKLEKKYGSKTDDLIVGIGPFASKNSFVKKNPLQKNDPRWREFLNKVEGEYEVDFVGFAKRQLAEGGVKKENIFESNIDTVGSSRFFSHVRDNNLPLAQQGRFACVAGIKG